VKKIVAILADFGLAWRLLTAVSLPFLPESTGRPAGKAAGYYPLVGLILGLALAAAGQLLYGWLPQGVSATMLLVIWVGLTGMLHLDGFMDTCDGLLPPRDPARRLEIMKDSRVGAFGAVGVILLLLLKFNGLAALPDALRGQTLIAAPVLARWAISWAMARYPLARTQGVSVFFKAGLGWLEVGFASVIAVGTVLILFKLGGLWLLVVAWLTATLLARFAVARIGGSIVSTHSVDSKLKSK